MRGGFYKSEIKTEGIFYKLLTVPCRGTSGDIYVFTFLSYYFKLFFDNGNGVALV